MKPVALGIAGIAVALAMTTSASAVEDEAVAARQVQIIRDCPTCPEIVVVPAGKFMMGTPGGAEEVDDDTGETPQIAITIEKAYGLGKTEVTTTQFTEFVNQSGHKIEPGCRLWNNRWLFDPKSDWRGAGMMRTPRPNSPAICVSWSDAQAYAAWLSKKTGKKYRLPSESEWEYAARAGTTAPRYFGVNSFEGVSISLACENANVYDVSAQTEYPLPYPYARCKDNAADLAPVGSYKPNAFGLYDMIGNVSEWVEDCYTASYWGRAPDQRAWTWAGGCEARGVRGGSWISRPADARSAKRDKAPTDTRTSYIGFRVARDMSEGEAK
ncbi:MAG: formylglycine-generating enzyme family protein [Rhodospirillaceae bacterium]|nr:formylglycine-generating enzyme family protein [Rhodospirillaceae bacterium]